MIVQAGWLAAGPFGGLLAIPAAFLPGFIYGRFLGRWVGRRRRERAEAYARAELRRAWAAHIHATRRN